MTVELIHPEGLIHVSLHHQVSIAQGSRLVSMAGQVSWDASGNLVGPGDLEKQAEQACLDVAAALRAAGASMGDVVRATVYVVGLDPEKSEQVGAGRRRAAERLGQDLQHPGTFVGVTSLFDPSHLIEIEATAVLQ